MRVFAVLLSFLGSRVWLVGAAAVSGAIIGLILALPIAPEIDRKSSEWCFDDDDSQSDNYFFIARSNLTACSNHDALKWSRGAQLTGSIEEIPHTEEIPYTAVINVSAQSEEPSRERR